MNTLNSLAKSVIQKHLSIAIDEIETRVKTNGVYLKEKNNLSKNSYDYLYESTNLWIEAISEIKEFQKLMGLK